MSDADASRVRWLRERTPVPANGPQAGVDGSPAPTYGRLARGVAAVPTRQPQQVAKALGAHVTGVCSTTKVDLARSLGADRVIDYTHADITDDDQRSELVLDIGGNRPLSQLRRWTGGIHRQLER